MARITNNFLAVTTTLSGAPLKWLPENNKAISELFDQKYVLVLKKGNYEEALKSEFLKNDYIIKFGIFSIIRMLPSFFYSHVLTFDFRSFVIFFFLPCKKRYHTIRGAVSSFNVYRVKIFKIFNALRSCRLLVPSRFIYKKIISYDLWPKEEIFYIPITFSEDIKGHPKKLNYNKIAVVANMYDWVKGHDLIIKIAKQLDDGFEIYLYGDGKMRSEIENLASNYHFGAKILFMGRREKEEIFSNNFGIGLVPSRSEGFGRSAAEFILNNRIVVSSDNGGIRELFTNELMKRLTYAPEDTSTAAEKIRLLNESSEQEISRILRSQKKCLSKLKPQNMENRIYEFFE